MTNYGVYFVSWMAVPCSPSATAVKYVTSWYTNHVTMKLNGTRQIWCVSDVTGPAYGYVWAYLHMFSPSSGQVPISQAIVHRNSNSIINPFCCNSMLSDLIATICYACHNTTAAMSCVKFCTNQSDRIRMRAKWNFHQVWIVMRKFISEKGFRAT